MERTVLNSFLLGTIQKSSSLRRLRGQVDLLRMIWTFVCEEYWESHIYRFPTAILDFEAVVKDGDDRDGNPLKVDLNSHGGCPLAIMAKGITFPNPQDERLCITMMPFELFSKDLETTLPACCAGYFHMIEHCKSFMKKETGQIGYVTIDEREVEEEGTSQRRGGLHVESAGTLPVFDHPLDRKRMAGAKNGLFVPSLEHHWGNGIMMRYNEVSTYTLYILIYPLFPFIHPLYGPLPIYPIYR